MCFKLFIFVLKSVYSFESIPVNVLYNFLSIRDAFFTNKISLKNKDD